MNKSVRLWLVTITTSVSVLLMFILNIFAGIVCLTATIPLFIYRKYYLLIISVVFDLVVLAIIFYFQFENLTLITDWIEKLILTLKILIPIGINILFLSLYIIHYRMFIDLKHIKNIHQEQEQKEWEKLIDPNNFDVKAKGSKVALGSTGTGKTANSLRFVEEAIKENKFVVTVNGKTIDKEYAVLNQIRKMCTKYNRELYIFNQKVGSETKAFDPFEGAESAEAMIDLVMSFTKWESEYYKNLTYDHWLCIIMMLRATDTKVSYANIIKYSNKDNYILLMRLLPDKDSMLFTTAESILNSDDHWDNITTAISYMGFMRGEIGGRLFFDEDNMFTLLQAYQENAVVVFDLDGLTYRDFAKSTGKMLINAIKQFIGHSSVVDLGTEIFVFFDEIGVFLDESLLDIINKGREYGVECLISTQSLGDIIALADDNYKDQVFDSINTYIIMRVNSPKFAEDIAKLIGTKQVKFKTVQTADDGTLTTGAGTTKWEDEFIANPNIIRGLPDNVGIFYNKTSGKNTVDKIYFRTSFINLEEEKS